MTRSGAPVPPAVFMGRATRVAPVAGSSPRFVRFSKAGISASNRRRWLKNFFEGPWLMLGVSRPTAPIVRSWASQLAASELWRTPRP